MMRVVLFVGGMILIAGLWHAYAQVPQTGAGLGAASTPVVGSNGQPCVLVNTAFECQQATVPLTLFGSNIMGSI